MYRKIITKKNLLMAWRRITTSGNYQYKRFYRELYSMYEVALQANLLYLHKCLKAQTFKANSPVKIFIPKPSGLQRPITLLHLEDQIVLQAFANILAERLREKRKKIECKYVFSNILNEQDNIFFVKHWRDSYHLYQNALTQEFNKGYKWVAHFDLASFYDTVSHDLLLRQLVPRAITSDVWKYFKSWLSKWTSSRECKNYSHGIPQGPSASDVLAEFFLLSIDLQMIKKGHRYYRYVDDIRLFGRKESDVRRATIDLDFCCREVGLVPQSSKHAIVLAKKLADVYGSLPSLHDFTKFPESGNNFEIKRAENIFESTLDNKTKEIIDKSRAKYILYRAPKSSIIFKHVLGLLSKQPEFIDAFASFLNQYCNSNYVKQRYQKMLYDKFPYEYVIGELWRLLSVDVVEKNKSLIQLAINTVKDNNRCFSARLGAYIFLAKCDLNGMGKYSYWIKNINPPLLQAMCVAFIPVLRINTDLIDKLLKRSSFEISTAILHLCMSNNVHLFNLDGKESKFPVQTKNIYYSLTNRFKTKSKIDFVNRILTDRFSIPNWKGWPYLLRAEYEHALGLLRSGDAVFDSNKSEWLGYMDSFNDLLNRCIQQMLKIKRLPGQMKIYQPGGKLIDFGVLIGPNTPFEKAYPNLAKHFGIAHKRRCQLPAYHPYDKSTGQRAKCLSKSERSNIIRSLKIIYGEIVSIGNSVGIK